MTGVMQVSRRQAALALDVVRRRHRRAPVRIRRRRSRRPVSLPSPVFVDLVVRVADDQPPLRIELVEAASARRAAGEWPSAYEVADMALRRAACDRVR
jgi:hypothetical protein